MHVLIACGAPPHTRVPQIIKVVKAIISTIVSALDSLLSWVQELIQQAIFKAIPEIKLLFRKLDFSEITKFFTDTKDKVRQKIVDFLNTMKEELGINKLYYVPAIDEYLRAHVWAEPSRKFITQQATVSGAPVLSFACDPGFYPVVGALESSRRRVCTIVLAGASVCVSASWFTHPFTNVTPSPPSRTPLLSFTQSTPSFTATFARRRTTGGTFASRARRAAPRRTSAVSHLLLLSPAASLHRLCRRKWRCLRPRSR